jgi:lysophospholipase L1-like esterase
LVLPGNNQYAGAADEPEQTEDSTTATSSPATTTTVRATTVVTAGEPSTVTTTPPSHPPGVLVVGDSVLEGLNLLGYRFGPDTVYDTEVSRSVLQLDAVMAEHEPPADLVIHLGTNGWWPTTAASFSAMLKTLEDRRIVLVNVSVDRPYTERANADLAALAQDLEHVTLVDWNGIASSQHVREDGYHPTMQGYEELARLIADALGLPATYSPLPSAQVAPAKVGQPS